MIDLGSAQIPFRSTTLVPTPESPGVARRWVFATLVDWGWSGDEDEVVLAVSELVTNAMLHAGGPIQLTMSCQDGDLWVSVHDDGVGRVTQRRLDDEATNGRGLQMLDQLSRSWGVITEPDGKHVWFELSAAHDHRQLVGTSA